MLKALSLVVSMVAGAPTALLYRWTLSSISCRPLNLAGSTAQLPATRRGMLFFFATSIDLLPIDVLGASAVTLAPASASACRTGAAPASLIATTTASAPSARTLDAYGWNAVVPGGQKMFLKSVTPLAASEAWAKPQSLGETFPVALRQRTFLNSPCLTSRPTFWGA